MPIETSVFEKEVTVAPIFIDKKEQYILYDKYHKVEREIK